MRAGILDLVWLLVFVALVVIALPLVFPGQPAPALP